jgi:hypothetical protein
MLTRSQARNVLALAQCPLDVDFHSLSTDQVETLIAYADTLKYRPPKNRNGSRARYFHAYLVRRATSLTAA